MTLRTTIYSRCTTGGHAGLSALISTRCYPDTVPEDANTGKFVVYHLISQDDASYRDRSGATLRANSRVQFDCYDATGAGADALGEQVKAAWNGWTSGCDVSRTRVLNRSQVYHEALDRYRQIVEVIIEHDASV